MGAMPHQGARRILALSYWKEKEATGNRVRFFQHGGPAADRGRYGMVPLTSLKGPLDGEPSSVTAEWPAVPAASATSGTPWEALCSA